MFDLIYPTTPAHIIPGMSMAVSGRKRMPAIEMLPVVEQSGIVVGQTPRVYAHGGSKILHPVVHLHVVSRYDKLLLQKRSPSKKICPGMWDTAVGGHITYGEQLMDALFRETEEEIGLRDINPIYICSYVFESQVERELVNVFAAVGDFALNPNPDEVTEVRWWPFDDIQNNLGKSIFTPNFEGEYIRVIENLKALL